MTVADVHVDLVRSMLTGDEELYERSKEQIQREGSDWGAEILLKMTFIRAARRRFGPGTTHGDVIRYVADARTREPLSTEVSDIRIAERLLLGALGDDDAMQGMTADDTMLIGPLLMDLTDRLSAPDDYDIEALLADAREHAEQAMHQLAD